MPLFIVLQQGAAYILPFVFFRDEKLGAQIFLLDGLMVNNCQCADTSENEVLSNFICQCLKGN